MSDSLSHTRTKRERPLSLTHTHDAHRWTPLSHACINTHTHDTQRGTHTPFYLSLPSLLHMITSWAVLLYHMLPAWPFASPQPRNNGAKWLCLKSLKPWVETNPSSLRNLWRRREVSPAARVSCHHLDYEDFMSWPEESWLAFTCHLKQPSPSSL